jgi:hypothetical protein
LSSEETFSPFEKIFTTLRSFIRDQEMERRGFTLMKQQDGCPAVCWDFTGSFRGRGREENAKTFNGVHSPRDQRELLFNLAILPEVKLELLK